jgi:hypothetical protein
MFIPRQPVVDNQFCEYVETSTTGGVGGAVAQAGAAVYLAGGPDYTGTNTAYEALVRMFATGAPAAIQPVFGLLMQKIKTGYHEVHPAGWVLNKDFGSSDAIAQPRYDTSGDIAGTQKVPVGVAHDGGIWDTTHYVGGAAGASAVEAGDKLYVTANYAGRLINSTAGAANYAPHTMADYPQFGEHDAGGSEWGAAALVIKGVSAAKAVSTLAGQTLYPIRIKLLV